MDVSCWSFIRMAELAEPLMKDGGTLSTMTYYGSQMVVENYNMMGPVKAALEAVTRYLAAELGPKGIRVHAISPGPLKTRAASGITDFDKLVVEGSVEGARPQPRVHRGCWRRGSLPLNERGEADYRRDALYRWWLSHHRLRRMMDPQNYTASETLKDGTPVTIRAIRHDDADTVLDAFKNLDRELGLPTLLQPKERV